MRDQTKNVLNLFKKELDYQSMLLTNAYCYEEDKDYVEWILQVKDKIDEIIGIIHHKLDGHNKEE